MSDVKRNQILRRLRTGTLIAFAALTLASAGVAAGDPAKPSPPSDKNPQADSPVTQSLGSYSLVSGTTVTLPPGGFASGVANCPAGQAVLGGGESNSAPGTLVLTDSWPISTTSWLVFVKSNDPAVTHTFTPRAVCGS